MKALLLVDIQNDFLPGGALPVPEGDQVVPICNALQAKFDLVVATRDWHPPNHGSFAANHPGRHAGDLIELNGLAQTLWPVHCVQDTPGAAFAPTLDMTKVSRIFRKGTDPAIDSYSGFFDNGHRKATGLAEYLKDTEVSDVYVCGLATDYCVKFTALDSVREGFKTFLIADATRGVNLLAGDVDAAMEKMRQAGVTIVSSDSL